jgi:ubiquinone/menaquinone biosynthesis C-methylase UbiE
MYERFAAVYDRLMGDVPYARYAEVWRALLAASGVRADRVMDVGCGTGTMFGPLLERARLVIGVDSSEAMLAQASVKARAYGQRVQLLQGQVQTLRSPVPVDGCVAICDVLNYVESVAELEQSFRAIAGCLQVGGWLFFDMHSPRKVAIELGDNLFCDVREDEIAIMKTSAGVREHSVSYDLVLMIKEDSGRYERFDEHHVQRAFTLTEIVEGLRKAGFRHVVGGIDFALSWTRPCGLEQDEWSFCVPDEERMAQASRWFFFATR